MKIKMVCKKPNAYGGKPRVFGDEVDINRHDVRLVTALGWFVPMEPKAQAPAKLAPKIQTRAIVAAPTPVAPAQESAAPEPVVGEQPIEAITATEYRAPAAEPASEPKPKRTYTRRDLNAET